MTSPRQKFWASLFVLFIAILACGSPTKLVSVNLNEERIQAIIQSTFVGLEEEDFLFSVTSVDIQDGKILVYGEYQLEGGVATPGSFEIALVIDDGVLKAGITSSQVHDKAMREEVLQKIKVRFVESLLEDVTEDRQQVEIVSVKIADGVVQVAFRFLP